MDDEVLGSVRYVHPYSIPDYHCIQFEQWANNSPFC